MNMSATTAAPIRLAASVVSKCSFTEVARQYTPALLTNASIRPNSLSTLLAAALIDASSVTSSCKAEMVPLDPAVRTASRAADPFSLDRLAIITWYFEEAAVMTLAAARPIPEFAPVDQTCQGWRAEACPNGSTGNQDNC